MKSTISIFFLLLTCICFSQVGKINGKLIIENSDDVLFAIENTYMILKNDTEKDSVKVRQDLNFNFENLKSGKYQLFFSHQNYPHNPYYNLELEENKPLEVTLDYAPSCPFGKSKTCPTCKKDDKVVPIVYGLLVEISYKDKKGRSIDKNGKRIRKNQKKNYKAGGCVVSDCQPLLYCERDKKRF
uniref:hypothetical protein n=1 Tax=Flavobacterium sp. TaxID=239 RepID=UPI0040497D86